MHSHSYRKIVIIAGLTVALATIAFFAAGEKFLRIESHAGNQGTDAVVVLAGYKADKARIEEGSALVRRGKGAYLILPLRHAAIDWPWTVRYFGLRDALPAHRVLIGRATARDEPLIDRYGGTYVEAVKTARIMRDRNLRSATIVSSAYHMRRAQIAFERFRRPGRLEFYYHPVDDDRPMDKPWWTDAAYVARVLQEYKKLLAAYLVYNLSPPSAP
jgi:hypothetical protein